MSSALLPEETCFISEFLVSNRRERIAWELARADRRADCIWRFAHCARELLIPARIHSVLVQKGKFMLEGIDFMQKIGNPQILLLSPFADRDRTKMGFQDAIDCNLGGGPYIAIDCGLQFAFIETESGCEGHEFLFLRR